MGEGRRGKERGCEYSEITRVLHPFYGCLPPQISQVARNGFHECQGSYCSEFKKCQRRVRKEKCGTRVVPGAQPILFAVTGPKRMGTVIAVGAR